MSVEGGALLVRPFTEYVIAPGQPACVLFHTMLGEFSPPDGSVLLSSLFTCFLVSFVSPLLWQRAARLLSSLLLA